MKSLLIIILSLTNISFAKIVNPIRKKKSFADQVMSKTTTTDKEAVSGQDCVGGGGGGR